MLGIVKRLWLGKPPPRAEQFLPWNTLGVFSLYRIALAVILLGLIWIDTGAFSVNPIHRVIFIIVDSVYLFYGIFNYLATKNHWFSFKALTISQVFIDISVLTILLCTSGIFYGFGILIIAAIAGGSILTAGRISLSYAAFASLALLVQHIFFGTNTWFALSGYTEVGFLGLIFFATAIIIYSLSQRIRQSEALASQRGIDLAKLEKLNELIIKRLRAGILVIDANDRVRFMNKAAWYLLGIPYREGAHCIGDLSPTLAKQLHEWQMKGDEKSFSVQTSFSGQGVLAEFSLITVAGDKKSPSQKVTTIFLEDTARMAQQAQQMKLASLGRLTASIAHEIRNPLSGISHAGQLLAESSHLSKQDLRLTEIIRQQSTRVNTVIENILQLSRRKQAAPEKLHLKSWLNEFTDQMIMQVDFPCRIEVDMENEALALFIDKSQFQQVLSNLCENGLRYSQDRTGVAEIKIIAGLTPNQDPFIEVIDYGPGVPADKVDVIFEPFFTTKSGGTGLGLYIAKELCEANRARLNYFPLEQGGSCFRITFYNPTPQDVN